MRPILVTKAQLVASLRDILRAVETDDSFEGSIEYAIPYEYDLTEQEWAELPEHQRALYEVRIGALGGPAEDGALMYTPKVNVFAVMGAWRVGNSMGQGGMAMLGDTSQASAEQLRHRELLIATDEVLRSVEDDGDTITVPRDVLDKLRKAAA